MLLQNEMVLILSVLVDYGAGEGAAATDSFDGGFVGFNFPLFGQSCMNEASERKGPGSGAGSTKVHEPVLVKCNCIKQPMALGEKLLG